MKLDTLTKSTLFKEISFILILFLLTRVSTWYLGYTSYKLLEPLSKHWYVWNYVEDKKIDIWGVWDSGHYINLAQEGYSTKISKNPETYGQANYGFFPLYPMALRYLNILTHNTVLAGMIISNLGLLGACIFLYYLVKQEYDETTAKYALLFMFSFPSAFIYTSVYSEGLFMFLSLGSVYFGRNNKFFLAGLFGFFAALTRNVGIYLFLPLLYFVTTSKSSFWKKATDLVKIAFVPLGTLTFALFIKSLTGNPLGFMTIQQAWGRQFDSPIKYLVEGFSSNFYQQNFAAMAATIALISLIVGAKYIKKPYLFYGLALVVTPLCTGLISLPRYLLVVFPIYIFLGGLTKKYPSVGYAILLIFAITQGMMLVFWTSGLDLLM